VEDDGGDVAGCGGDDEDDHDPGQVDEVCAGDPVLVLLLVDSRLRPLGATAEVGATPEGLWNGGWRPAPGQEPMVSVQIASFNEARVIERLLEACTRLTYPNYEVILCDDSDDPEMLSILDRWCDRPNFKIIHRDTRAGGLERAGWRGPYLPLLGTAWAGSPRSCSASA
jgi:hypothetical protein